MSVLLNFAMFPTDKGGKGISKYVSKVINMIDESGVSYKLNPMGTTIETATMQEALAMVQKAYDILEPDADRIYSSITIDIRKDRVDGMQQKIASIEKRIGEVNQ
ncbi:uncharacterized protein (TIGR00106 family) [Balneicella halophila]|uniref:Uncharacterized protein (TIGR00106 family) n=1 Tax=Balneicella halophila TaxID=1537566 RepID=A0A7L4UN32_BALHA|nr:MTH1187 family thiamine-binding protein [Balneicella halophila]PVX49949.1 uncharacterized protein (TIGR00106 family) [Balneicella halophila]